MGHEEVTVSEAGRLLRITPTAVRELIARGRLEARRVGPIWVLQLADVRNYQRERSARRQPGPPPRRRETDLGQQTAAA